MPKTLIFQLLLLVVVSRYGRKAALPKQRARIRGKRVQVITPRTWTRTRTTTTTRPEAKRIDKLKIQAHSGDKNPEVGRRRICQHENGSGTNNNKP